MGKFIDLTGQRFDKLTVLFRDVQYEKENNKHDGAYWRCQCDCGNQCVKKGALLRYGHYKSCGCLHSEQAKINGGYKDLTGKRFGYLIVLKEDNNYRKEFNINSNHTYWVCQCDCGEQKSILGISLLSGATTSCGKCSRSHGEEKIEKILKENNISFQREKIFPNCKSKNNRPLRFDFYIDNSFLLEYDGIQHYKYTNSGWNTKENFIESKENDKYKNEWCLKNKIPLKRIPYWDLKNLTIKDIMEDKYLIKE